MICKAKLETNIAAARLYLLNNAPFFGALLYGTQINITDDEEAPSCAWTDGDEIFFNVPMLGTLLEESVEEYPKIPEKRVVFESVTFLIIHELMHCMLLHLDRRKSRDPLIWNYAADLTINILIKSWFNLLTPPGTVAYAHFTYLRERDESTEVVYDKIIENTPKVSYDPSSGKGTIKHPNGREETFHVDLQGSGTAGDERKDQWESRIEHAKNASGGECTPRGSGGHSSRVEDILDTIYEPKVDWRQLIDHLGGELSKGDFSFRQQSKSSIGTNYYLPSMRTYEPFVVIAIDTSGSISKKEYTHFMSEVKAILSLHNCKVGVIQCDADVVDYVELESNDQTPPIKGGGGTRFSPVFEYANKLNRNIDALIYFTDGYNCDQGFEKNMYVSYPVVWVMTTDAGAPELGRSLRYDPYS